MALIGVLTPRDLRILMDSMIWEPPPRLTRAECEAEQYLAVRVPFTDVVDISLISFDKQTTYTWAPLHTFLLNHGVTI